MHRRSSKSVTAPPTAPLPRGDPANAPPTIHVEPSHADSDPITASKFPFHDLIPNWSNFDPHTKNAANRSTFASSHHGGNGAKSKRDFTKFSSACCLEWIDKVEDGKVWRVRCMNVFTVKSEQCTVHKKILFKDGPNKVYEAMTKGMDATWGDIKDRK